MAAIGMPQRFIALFRNRVDSADGQA